MDKRQMLHEPSAPDGCLREAIGHAAGAKERLLQVHRLETIGQLAGGLLHDFNNLLLVCDGQLELIEEMVYGLPAVREPLQACRRAFERTRSLTRGMLAFLRDGAPHPEPLNLGGIIDDFTMLLRLAVGSKVRVTVDHALDLWPCAADRNQMLNAVLNLAINARDAMPGGGGLHLAIRNASLAVGDAAVSAGAVPGDYVVLAVADTGTGMPAEVLARASEPFFTTKHHTKGNGLGLSMVQCFAKQSGGTLAIESEPGRGTVVRIYLPRAKE
jgi:signal transduction histidine kinase